MSFAHAVDEMTAIIRAVERLPILIIMVAVVVICFLIRDL
jgi:hypothetical protein